MRFVPSIIENMSSDLYGERQTLGRVTVEHNWQLNSTFPMYGGSDKGPFRWFQDKADTGVEWEVPNIKSIEWDRSESQDIATCTITLFNTWHEGNVQVAEMDGQLGKPGYFWPKRGLEFNRWGQIAGRGSFRRDGFWDPNFNWQNVLMPYAMIRTYEGAGRPSSSATFYSVDDHLVANEVLQTGTWLIDSITASSNGEMVLNCKDMGKLLLEQLCFPPTIPQALYPLDYYPAGKSPFDSYFGAKPRNGVSPASFGEVRTLYHSSSLDVKTGVTNSSVAGHFGSHSNDGNWDTFSLSDGFDTPGGGTVHWQFTVNQGISKIALKAWAGGYECYVSIYRGGVWLGSEVVPGGAANYVTKVNIPYAIPNGRENVVNIDLPSSLMVTNPDGTRSVHADYIALSFRNLYYSGITDSSGGVYRAGIRDLVVLREGVKVNPYSPDFSALPWTYSMASHPTRGYWVVDNAGTVHGFGDAANYDSTAFGPVPIVPAAGAGENMIRAMTAHPDGKGYWCIDLQGRVYAYGSAAHHGEVVIPWAGSDVWGGEGLQAWDITPTYTGNGYWVIYGNGVVHGFGDAVTAATPSYIVLPTSNVDLFMNAVVHPLWLVQRRGNGICGHPSRIGFWATTGSGEVYAYGAAQFKGQLHNRVYNAGMADQFRLLRTEFTRSIETTATGEGYWIAFGSGHIAAYGDAVGQGPTYIHPNRAPGISLPVDETNIRDWGFYRALTWDLARDPDGTGFWVLIADGSVKSYNAEFWGQPGYHGLTGFRWHEGNYESYEDIIKDLLSWAGWVIYDPSATDVEILGQIEGMGIKTDTPLTADKFDKRPILDIIKELAEVVAYTFYVREDGGVVVQSRNVWRSGNFDEDGVRIYVDGNSLDRVPSTDPNAVEFIPMIDENENLFSYSASLNSSSMRSEVIVGTDQPDPNFPTRTGFTRFVPRSATEEFAPGRKMMRNVPRPAMWINQNFTNNEEAALMAELIALNAWFAERMSSVDCVAMPYLQIGDQVKIAERNTSEYNIHYVTGIRSNHDLTTGEWTYSLQTHWLGDKDNWVITADASQAPVSGQHYVQVSERVDRWQQLTGRDLQKGGLANGAPGLSSMFEVAGNFTRSVITQDSEDMWKFEGALTMYKRYSSLSFVVEDISPPLGNTVFVKIYDDSDALIKSFTSVGSNVRILIPGYLGDDNTIRSYRIVLEGYHPVVGNGFLKFAFRDGSQYKGGSEGNILVVG